MRTPSLLAALIALALPAVTGRAAAEDPQALVHAAVAPVMQQLEAFRRDDFDTGYTFASASIRELFDRAMFERMVRAGYPEIARSVSASVADSEVVSEATVYLTLRVRGANGRSVEAVYEMVREDAGWRINGVQTRPAQGA